MSLYHTCRFCYKCPECYGKSCTTYLEEEHRPKKSVDDTGVYIICPRCQHKHYTLKKNGNTD